MNKKGNLDSPVIAVGVFAIAVAIILSAVVISSGLTAFAGTTLSTTLLTKAQTMFMNMGTTGFIFIILALIIFNLMGSFFLPTHPIFVIIDIIFIPISIWIAAIVSNTWETTMATMATTYGYTLMNTIMGNLVTIIVVTDIITAIASYAIIKNNYG